MMGKIIGIAFVGLTQFALWIILTFSIITIASKVLINDKEIITQQLQSASILDKNNQMIKNLKMQTFFLHLILKKF
jgi:ABC-2 type transport system permease protein